MHMGKRFITLFNIFLLMILILLSSPSDSIAAEKYAVLKLQGSVNPVVSEYLTKHISKAALEGASFIVLQLDTPGGLLTSMREIITGILTSKIPVVVYTYPKGGQAASAGGFIMLSAHVAAMSPGTEIGAMHPVSPMLNFMKKDKEGAPEGPMEKKVLNDTIAYARSLAQKRKRNVKWATKAVKEAISNTYKEALSLGIIDLVAEDMDDLMKKLNGMTIDLNGSAYTFKTAGIKPFEYQMDWKQKLLNYFADPQIIFLLLIISIVGIGIEFKSPGMIVPGTVGAIALFIFLMAIQVIPINVVGLVLIILAIVLFILELSITSYGLLTIGGIVSFMLGSMILFDSPLPGGHIPMSSIIATVLVVLGLVFFVVRSIFNVYKGEVSTGKEGLMRKKGISLKDFDKTGKVNVHGEIWSAESEDEIKTGDSIEVVEVREMVLIVKKIES
jgi:membrane-bound serine protease (ClpP class)